MYSKRYKYDKGEYVLIKDIKYRMKKIDSQL